VPLYSYGTAALVVTVFSLGLKYLGVSGTVAAMTQKFSSGLAVLRSATATDDEKERSARQTAIVTITATTILLAKTMIAAAAGMLVGFLSVVLRLTTWSSLADALVFWPILLFGVVASAFSLAKRQ
jgi:hypothetical protein